MKYYDFRVTGESFASAIHPKYNAWQWCNPREQKSLKTVQKRYLFKIQACLACVKVFSYFCC